MEECLLINMEGTTEFEKYYPFFKNPKKSFQIALIVHGDAEHGEQDMGKAPNSSDILVTTK